MICITGGFYNPSLALSQVNLSHNPLYVASIVLILRQILCKFNYVHLHNGSKEVHF